MTGREILDRLSASLARSGERFVVLHSADELDGLIDFDVDVAMRREWLPDKLARHIRDELGDQGVRLVQLIQHGTTGFYYVLAGNIDQLPGSALRFDVWTEYRREGTTLYSSERLLRGDERRNGWDVPEPGVEFGCYLAKRITKADLPASSAEKLHRRYVANTSEARHELAYLLGSSRGEAVAQAAETNDWSRVRERISEHRRVLLRRSRRRAPWRLLLNPLAEAGRLLRRWRRPTGLHVVVLGVDGAGKSTALDRLEQSLEPFFWRQQRLHWSPAVLRRKPALTGPVVDPHRLPPRGLLGSIAQLAYLFAEFTLGHLLRVRLPKARSTLVLSDRYFPDLLVDPHRYRYGGPRWLARLAWKLMPKPDLVVLLDVSVEQALARAQELPREEIARQRDEYRALVGSMSQGRIVNADQPADHVASALASNIIDELERRTAQSLGLAPP